eukprot:scaffold52130_cov15-Tisochrysis_lutea.AAC.1
MNCQAVGAPAAEEKADWQAAGDVAEDEEAEVAAWEGPQLPQLLLCCLSDWWLAQRNGRPLGGPSRRDGRHWGPTGRSTRGPPEEATQIVAVLNTG